MFLVYWSTYQIIIKYCAWNILQFSRKTALDFHMTYRKKYTRIFYRSIHKIYILCYLKKFNELIWRRTCESHVYVSPVVLWLVTFYTVRVWKIKWNIVSSNSSFSVGFIRKWGDGCKSINSPKMICRNTHVHIFSLDNLLIF